MRGLLYVCLLGKCEKILLLVSLSKRGKLKGLPIISGDDFPWMYTASYNDAETSKPIDECVNEYFSKTVKKYDTYIELNFYKIELLGKLVV